VAVSASGLYKNRGLLENGGRSTKNVYRTPIANRGRSIEWSRYFYYASPPGGGFRFRSYKNRGLLENGGSWIRILYRTPIANQGRPIKWSSYFRHAAPPSGCFRFRSVITTTEIANNSKTVAAARKLSAEHQ
jgi:hypothetical protein